MNPCLLTVFNRGFAIVALAALTSMVAVAQDTKTIEARMLMAAQRSPIGSFSSSAVELVFGVSPWASGPRLNLVFGGYAPPNNRVQTDEGRFKPSGSAVVGLRLAAGSMVAVEGGLEARFSGEDYAGHGTAKNALWAVVSVSYPFRLSRSRAITVGVQVGATAKSGNMPTNELAAFTGFRF